MTRPLFERALKTITESTFTKDVGKLTAVHGLILEASGCNVQQGELVEIVQARTGTISLAQVVGLTERSTLLMPFESVEGLCLDSEVVPQGKGLKFPVSDQILGRILSPLGEPLDSEQPLNQADLLNTFRKPLNPLARAPIKHKLNTGVKAIDIFTPLGRGQRIGIFAGSGVGKSTLLGMVAKYSSADVIVIALVGERGREVGDFVRESLGEEGLKRSVLIAATAGDTAVMKRQAAYSATTVAEWFRDKGKDVLLIMDSVTRFAMAQREIGISTGEPLGSRGYPPSVFALLPPMLERPGNLMGSGSITAVYTVLVEGDDFNEPISDFMRSMLDGHILLSRDLAARGQYPAMDVAKSISRLAKSVQTPEEAKIANKLRELIAHFEQTKEIIELGIYKKGSNWKTDVAIELQDEFIKLLEQSSEMPMSYETTARLAEQLYKKIVAKNER